MVKWGPGWNEFSQQPSGDSDPMHWQHVTAATRGAMGKLPPVGQQLGGTSSSDSDLNLHDSCDGDSASRASSHHPPPQLRQQATHALVSAAAGLVPLAGIITVGNLVITACLKHARKVREQRSGTSRLQLPGDQATVTDLLAQSRLVHSHLSALSWAL